MAVVLPFLFTGRSQRKWIVFNRDANFTGQMQRNNLSRSDSWSIHSDSRVRHRWMVVSMSLSTAAYGFYDREGLEGLNSRRERQHLGWLRLNPCAAPLCSRAFDLGGENASREWI